MDKQKLLNRRDPNKLAPYILIAPTLIFVILMFIYPLFITLSYSLQDISMMKQEGDYVGLQNYLDLFSDQEFLTTLSRTAKWTISSVLIKLIVGLALALLLNQHLIGGRMYFILLIIAWAMPKTVTGIIWDWIYDGNYGHWNYILLKLGLISKKISWLGDRKLAFIATIITDAWAGIPFMAFNILSGLKSIPKSLYEAADMDGANSFQKFFFITLPQLKNIIMIITTLSFVWTFNSFNIIWMLTKGGPVDATETMIIRIYKEAFSKYNVSKSSAMALIVFLILLLLSFIYSRLITREEE